MTKDRSAQGVGQRTIGRDVKPRIPAEPPKWSSWREATAVVLYPPHLRKTVRIALVVGTILFAINQLDVVLRGDATVALWLKAALTYVVPFGVSNSGILVATRRPSEQDTDAVSPDESIANDV